MHLKFTQKMTEKQENGTVYEKIMFFLFCNFFDDENKKIKKTFFVTKRFLFQVSIPSCGGLPGSSHQFWR